MNTLHIGTGRFLDTLPLGSVHGMELRISILCDDTGSPRTLIKEKQNNKYLLDEYNVINYGIGGQIGNQ